VKQRVRVVLVLLALTGAVLWFLLPQNEARHAAERIRRSLRQEGFKVDFSELDLSMPDGLGANNETLMLAADASRNVFSLRRLDLLRPVNSNSAMVIWRQDNPVVDVIDDHFWPELRQSYAERGAYLDGACEAVISAPFRFRTVLATNGELTPDVLRARLLGLSMAARTILELHDQHHSAAWTNLLALTRLVTAWQTEPLEISHLIRFRWVATAQRVTWEALQAKDWSDSELACLQHEWESPSFFSGLPETAAVGRASTIELCDFQRRQPPPPGPTLREFATELINSPNRVWSEATSGWRNARYRNYESYEDEMAWLLYFRDCELDYRRALTANSWSELRTLQSATNARPARASDSLPGIDAFRTGGAGYQRQGATLLTRAAETEARRRLLVTAIALERFHLANHCYPGTLSKLEPDFLKSPARDFMDGELLRYRRTDDDRFLLYSVGIDGIDDHGQLQSEVGPAFGRSEGPDIVWPLPASTEEVRAYARAAETRRANGPARSMTPEGQKGRRRGLNNQPMRTNSISAPGTSRGTAF
jgi:hypothetical protein